MLQTTFQILSFLRTTENPKREQEERGGRGKGKEVRRGGAGEEEGSERDPWSKSMKSPSSECTAVTPWKISRWGEGYS